MTHFIKIFTLLQWSGTEPSVSEVCLCKINNLCFLLKNLDRRNKLKPKKEKKEIGNIWAEINKGQIIRKSVKLEVGSWKRLIILINPWQD